MTKIYACTQTYGGEYLLAFELTNELAEAILGASKIIEQPLVKGVMFRADVCVGWNDNDLFSEAFNKLTIEKYLFLTEDVFDSQNIPRAGEDGAHLEMVAGSVYPTAGWDNGESQEGAGLEIEVFKDFLEGRLRAKSLKVALAEVEA